MRNQTEIINRYTLGEATLAETNAALEALGSPVRLDPERNAIRPEEITSHGLLDTGTGSLDKVYIRNGRMVNADCGEMTAYVYFGGSCYLVDGDKLIYSEGD